MPIKKRSITIAGHATSITLEDEFWTSLEQIANAHQLSIPALVARIDEMRGEDQNLSSAIRVHILEYFKSRSQEYHTDIAAQMENAPQV